MTRRLIMYADGSRVLSKDRRVQSFGWSIVALHGDEHHECRGHVLGGRMSPLGGHHEQIAIVHGIEYAHRQGFDFRDVTIFCDDEIFGYAQTYLHPGNFHNRRVDQIDSRLRCVVSHCFDPEMMRLSLRALQESRIVKLKGHSRHVYQERADHLARYAAHEGCGTEPRDPPLDIESWMRQGLDWYNATEEGCVRRTWYAPFVVALAERQAPEMPADTA